MEILSMLLYTPSGICGSKKKVFVLNFYFLPIGQICIINIKHCCHDGRWNAKATTALCCIMQ